MRHRFVALICTTSLELFLTSALLSAYASAAAVGRQPPEALHKNPRPMNAVRAVLKAFDRHSIVAIGEAHWLKQEHEFLSTLIRTPAFTDRVNDIVVEFGNALYQETIDRYTAGEYIPEADLRKVWRNCVGTEFTWESPLYEQFFAVVREVNTSRPKSHQLRILLGDPPIDWARVQKVEDRVPFQWERHNQFFTLVENEVLSKQRRALLIAGTLHLLRDSGTPAGMPLPKPPARPDGPLQSLIQLPPAQAPIQYIEEYHPGATFVIMPHVGFGQRTAELEPRMATWPNPSIASVKGTWLGNVEWGPIIAPNVTMTIGGSRVKPFEGKRFQDLADAYLYLGPRSSLLAVPPRPTTYAEDAYFQEMNRRNMLKTGKPLDRDDLIQDAEKGVRPYQEIFK